MNEATYVYIVHSDINENNIYAEFATEEEAIDYARRHKDELTYVDKVEAALDEAGEIIEIFDGQTIWVYDEEDDFKVEEEFNEFNIDFEDEEPLSEAVRFRTREEQDEFFRLCNEIGLITIKDIGNFKKEVGCTDDNLLQALRDYRAELGPDFEIKEEIDFDKLVEELEEHEDMVECKECYNLVAKESCIKGEHGYVCENCSKTLVESISELAPAQLTEMETYLRTGKDLHLEEYEEEHADFAIDIVGGELTYNEKTNTFDFYLSIYHASEDNNAEYPEYHTDEEEYSFDSLEEIYDEFPQYLIDIYKLSHHEFSKVEETLTEETIESDQELEGTDNAVVDCKVADVVAHSEDEKPVDCEGEEKPLEKPLVEETHAQYAKPEGNRIQAYNNALTYAKKNNCDYIYGYTNYAGKFFALEQPIKAKDSDAEEQFRKQYKNCKVVYMVYPDKAFLKESLYNFTPEEMEEYGCDEEGYSVEGWDTFVRCNWCKEVYAEYDCVFEANLGWLCPRCQDEIRSHGGPLTIMDYPSEDDIRRTLEEATKMTKDELMDKHGTDDVDLINAGRPEEERVELIEE